VTVVDVSADGALLEAARPLRPGGHVEMQFEHATHRLRIGGTVVRCGVAAIDPEHGPTYRAAIAFNQTFDWVREDGTPEGYRVPGTAGPRQGEGSRSRK
jgi:hypothetical protein